MGTASQIPSQGLHGKRALHAGDDSQGPSRGGNHDCDCGDLFQNPRTHPHRVKTYRREGKIRAKIPHATERRNHRRHPRRGHENNGLRNHLRTQPRRHETQAHRQEEARMKIICEFFIGFCLNTTPQPRKFQRQKGN